MPLKTTHNKRSGTKRKAESKQKEPSYEVRAVPVWTIWLQNLKARLNFRAKQGNIIIFPFARLLYWENDEYSEHLGIMDTVDEYWIRLRPLHRPDSSATLFSRSSVSRIKQYKNLGTLRRDRSLLPSKIRPNEPYFR